MIKVCLYAMTGPFQAADEKYFPTLADARQFVNEWTTELGFTNIYWRNIDGVEYVRGHDFAGWHEIASIESD